MLERDVCIPINLYSKTNYNFNWCVGSQCEENSVQIVGELSQNEGQILICLGGRWGKVCGGWRGASVTVAAVVCRQLGFSTKGNLK